MSELIDRQAAIKAICEKECDALKPCQAECKSLWAVKELPTIDPQPKWVPVTERLPDPDKKQDVLVTLNYFKPEVETDIWDGEVFFYYGKNVVAWMPFPFPEPWVEESTPVNLSGLYRCDPEKNTECTKEGCHINGGECWLTSKREYWKVDE